MSISSQSPARLVIFLSLFSSLLGLGDFSPAAEQPSKTPAVTLRHSQTAAWHVAESDNFRFFHHSQPEIVQRIATLCEESRRTIRKRWLPDQGLQNWTIKCDVYLYPTAQEFQQKTRFPADSWGFADMEIGQGRVWMRRLDLRSDVEARLTSVAVHELTHVVLADRFAIRQIPRWADEGIALNSEPPKRQQDLRRWLAGEIRQGRGFSLSQLMAVRQYPSDKHLGDLFYAQSGSLIEFLVSQNADLEPGVLRLVEESQHHGTGKPLQGVSLAQLETEWKAWLLKTENGLKVAADRP